MLTLELMERMWPHGDAHIPGLRAAIAAQAADIFPKYGLDSPLVVAHAMAQFSEECGAGLEVVENISYSSAARIAAVWPSRFSTASALPYVRNPRKLANNVYGSRMGNRAGTDDGYNYIGRGGSQVTGHDGYAALGAKLGLDLLANPDWVNDPRWFLECSVADFVLCGCLPFAKRDDVRGVTHHLNGGYIGLSEREAWLTRWKGVLLTDDHQPSPLPQSMGIGSKGWEVEAIQKRLADLGYNLGAADGTFGNATRAAVLAFQADSGLPTTGRVDDATKAALTSAPPKPVAEERQQATAADLRTQGSGTVADADKMVTVAKIGAGLAAAGGTAEATGPSAPAVPVPDPTPITTPLDHAHSWLDQFSALKEVAEGARDAIHYVGGHWWILIGLGACVVWYFGGSIIRRRVADHQAGANMAR